MGRKIQGKKMKKGRKLEEEKNEKEDEGRELSEVSFLL